MLNHSSGNLASNGKSARLSRGKVLQRNRTGYEDGNAYARQYSKVDLRTRINEHAILQHVSTNTQDAVLHSVVVCLLDMWGRNMLSWRWRLEERGRQECGRQEWERQEWGHSKKGGATPRRRNCKKHPCPGDWRPWISNGPARPLKSTTHIAARGESYGGDPGRGTNESDSPTSGNVMDPHPSLPEDGDLTFWTPMPSLEILMRYGPWI